MILAFLAFAVLSMPVEAATLNQRVTHLEKQMIAVQKRAVAQAENNKAQRIAIQGLAKRLKAVERNTSYFKSSKQPPAPKDASGLKTHNAFTEAVTLPNSTSPFLVYLWLDGTAGFTGDPAGYLHYAVLVDGEAPCQENLENAGPASTWELAQFCSFTVDPGQSVSVVIDATNGDLGDVAVSVSANFVEMVKP